MAVDQDMRERLVRVEMGHQTLDRDLSRLERHHELISTSHSKRLYAAEQAINTVTREQAESRTAIQRLKEADSKAELMRTRNAVLIEAAKWIGGGAIAVGIVFDALPADATKPLRAWLGLP